MDSGAVRILVALAMLTGASILDIRVRRVPNRYWFPFIGAAAAFLIGDVRDAMADHALHRLVTPYVTAAVLALAFRVFFELHLFGGADAKGLMVLAFLVPASPANQMLAPGQPLMVPYSVAAIVNGTLVVVLIPLVFLAINAVRGELRFPAALLGITMPTAAARARHVWPMQDVQADGSIRWHYWQRIGISMDERYDSLERHKVERVWITPKLPFMVGLAGGLALAWWQGNVLLRLMQAIVQP